MTELSSRYGHIVRGYGVERVSSRTEAHESRYSSSRKSLRLLSRGTGLVWRDLADAEKEWREEGEKMAGAGRFCVECWDYEATHHHCAGEVSGWTLISFLALEGLEAVLNWRCCDPGPIGKCDYRRSEAKAFLFVWPIFLSKPPSLSLPGRSRRREYM